METVASMTGTRKAAILVVALGEEAASDLCQHLPPAALQKLVGEIRNLGAVSPAEAAAVLEEYYRQLLGAPGGPARGGPEFAQRLITRAFGAERANELLESFSDQETASLHSLEAADPQQLARFLEGESPQTIALVLAHLGSKAAPALLLLPEAARVEAVRRLANLNEFSRETVRQILQVLDKKVQAMARHDRREYGGARAVADLLNRLDPGSSKSILETIEQSDVKQAVEIRNLMFTFEDLTTIPESGIRELLGQVDKKTLAIALKGASLDVKNHIFKSMSSRAVEMLKEDMEALGPVRLRDAEQARQEVVALVRKLESDGKISLKAAGDEYVV
ncbi:MAG TPA: flagellar motor switch protein FliG [Terriglobia bacterium]|nr:flagellar motor switch protein FliG [Terriglobia bacterium]